MKYPLLKYSPEVYRFMIFTDQGLALKLLHVGWTEGVSPVFTGLLLGLGGVGWDVNVHVTLMMLRSSSGVGVGWGGMLKFMLR